ncbi:hypothetical protein GCM10023083_75840 [Streptomyces phyllanthi]
MVHSSRTARRPVRGQVPVPDAGAFRLDRSEVRRVHVGLLSTSSLRFNQSASNSRRLRCVVNPARDAYESFSTARSGLAAGHQDSWSDNRLDCQGN